LHYDLLFIKRVDDPIFPEYVVVLEDLSHYVQLSLPIATDYFMVLEYLLKWLKIFNVAKIHISDSGSRLQTPDISEANRLFGTDHHFRTGYCVKARKQFRGFTRKFSRC